MAKNGIDVQEQCEQLLSFYWLPKLHENLMVPGSFVLPINAPQNSFHRHLLLVLKQYLLIINNMLMVFITILELIAFGLRKMMKGLRDQLKKPITKTYLLFLSNIISNVNKFNVLYQSSPLNIH